MSFSTLDAMLGWVACVCGMSYPYYVGTLSSIMTSQKSQFEHHLSMLQNAHGYAAVQRFILMHSLITVEIESIVGLAQPAGTDRT